jgi:DNA-binding SARP family transcriptional activator
VVVRFGILGTLEVEDGERPVPLGGGRQRALLALLLVHANEVVSVDRIAEELWHGRPPASAAKIVQKYVLELRRSVGAARLERRGMGYLLHAGADEIDAAWFRRLLDEGRARDALALWRGPPLAEFADEPFARGEIARLDELHAQAVEYELEERLADGGGPDLIGELRDLVELHPLREGPRRLLMLALYRAGRQAEALQVYRESRTVLADELGLEPTPALRELERAILTHDPALTPSTPPAARRRRHGRIGIAIAGAGALLAAAAAIAISFAVGGGAPVSLPHSVGVVALNSGRLIADTGFASGPDAVAVGGGSVWIGSRTQQTVLRIDPVTRRVTETIGVVTDVRALAVGFGELWAAGGSRLTKIDLTTGAVQATIVPAAHRGTVTAVAVGTRGVFATFSGGAVVQVDPWTGKTIRRVRVPAPATGVAIDGDSVYVTSGGRGAFTTVGPTGLTTTVRTLGSASDPVVAHDHSVWILAGTADRSLWRNSGIGFNPVEIPTTQGLVSLADVPDHIWAAADSGELLEIDQSTQKTVHVVNLGRAATALVARGNVLWVAFT